MPRPHDSRASAGCRFGARDRTGSGGRLNAMTRGGPPGVASECVSPDGHTPCGFTILPEHVLRPRQRGFNCGCQVLVADVLMEFGAFHHARRLIAHATE